MGVQALPLSRWLTQVGVTAEFQDFKCYQFLHLVTKNGRKFPHNLNKELGHLKDLASGNYKSDFDYLLDYLPVEK